jgi:hypothetical protein
MTTPKETLLQALSSHRGDDLYRAISAFRNCTPTEMHQEYGQSGKTRHQIITEYQAHEDACTEAENYLKALP